MDDAPARKIISLFFSWVDYMLLFRAKCVG